MSKTPYENLKDVVDDKFRKVDITVVAIAMVLKAKGLMTDEEFEIAHAKATHHMDQLWARRQEEVESLIKGGN